MSARFRSCTIRFPTVVHVADFLLLAPRYLVYRWHEGDLRVTVESEAEIEGIEAVARKAGGEPGSWEERER